MYFFFLFFLKIDLKWPVSFFLFQFKVSVSTLYIIIPSQSHSLCSHQMTSKQSATHVVCWSVQSLTSLGQRTKRNGTIIMTQQNVTQKTTFERLNTSRSPEERTQKHMWPWATEITENNGWLGSCWRTRMFSLFPYQEEWRGQWRQRGNRASVRPRRCRPWQNRTATSSSRGWPRPPRRSLLTRPDRLHREANRLKWRGHRSQTQ